MTVEFTYEAGGLLKELIKEGLLKGLTPSTVSTMLHDSPTLLKSLMLL